MNYLSPEDLKEINRDVIAATGGAAGAVNEANLFHVCNRVKSFGKTAVDKAAYYLYELAFSVHAFTDGNKRTALTVCSSFLEKNGYRLDVDDEELVGVALLVASGSKPFPEVKRWLKVKAKKFRLQQGSG